MMLSSLKPTKEGDYLYPDYIFLRDYSLISIKIEFLEQTKWNFVTMLAFDSPNFETILSFETYMTPFYSTFINIS